MAEQNVGRKSKKQRQSAHNSKTGKYARQFFRTLQHKQNRVRHQWMLWCRNHDGLGAAGKDAKLMAMLSRITARTS